MNCSYSFSKLTKTLSEYSLKNAQVNKKCTYVLIVCTKNNTRKCELAANNSSKVCLRINKNNRTTIKYPPVYVFQRGLVVWDFGPDRRATELETWTFPVPVRRPVVTVLRIFSCWFSIVPATILKNENHLRRRRWQLNERVT